MGGKGNPQPSEGVIQSVTGEKSPLLSSGKPSSSSRPPSHAEPVRSKLWGELGVWHQEWGRTLDSRGGTCVCPLGFPEAGGLLEELPSWPGGAEGVCWEGKDGAPGSGKHGEQRTEVGRAA